MFFLLSALDPVFIQAAQLQTDAQPWTRNTKPSAQHHVIFYLHCADNNAKRLTFQCTQFSGFASSWSPSVQIILPLPTPFLSKLVGSPIARTQVMHVFRIHIWSIHDSCISSINPIPTGNMRLILLNHSAVCAFLPLMVLN